MQTYAREARHHTEFHLSFGFHPMSFIQWISDVQLKFRLPHPAYGIHVLNTWFMKPQWPWPLYIYTHIHTRTIWWLRDLERNKQTQPEQAWLPPVSPSLMKTAAQRGWWWYFKWKKTLPNFPVVRECAIKGCKNNIVKRWQRKFIITPFVTMN